MSQEKYKKISKLISLITSVFLTGISLGLFLEIFYVGIYDLGDLLKMFFWIVILVLLLIFGVYLSDIVLLSYLGNVFNRFFKFIMREIRRFFKRIY